MTFSFGTNNSATSTTASSAFGFGQTQATDQGMSFIIVDATY